MECSIRQMVIVAPLLVSSSYVLADVSGDVNYSSDPFAFDSSELDRIRFTRSEDIDIDIHTGLSALGSDRSDAYREDFPSHSDHSPFLSHQTEVSFKLKPKRPDFSRAGAYGLDLFTDPRLDVRRKVVGAEGISATPADLHQGFEYSAGLRIEHEDAQIDGTAYVSSSLLGLSYGRLGRLWYGAIDVNLEQFAADEFGEAPSDVLSLDVTTGRRLGFTGLDAHSPLWLLSVQGNLDMREWESNDDLESSSDWFLNPSLLWQQPGFTFSAQMQLPVEFETLDDEGKPDYRLRAVFEKQFK